MWCEMVRGWVDYKSNLKDPKSHCVALLSLSDIYATGSLRYVQPTIRDHSVDGFVASRVIEDFTTP